MFIPDGTSIMRCVGGALREACGGNLLHVLRKIHTFHHLAETIRQYNREVNAIITSTTSLKVFENFTE